MAVTAAAPAWGLNPVVRLHWRNWGDDSIAFEERSGQLFQLDALSAAAMACLEERAQTLAEVVDALAADLQQAPDAELHDTVGEIVAYFHRLGWVEPIISA